MRINDEVDTNKDELLDERQSTAQKPKRDRNKRISNFQIIKAKIKDGVWLGLNWFSCLVIYYNSKFSTKTTVVYFQFN